MIYAVGSTPASMQSFGAYKGKGSVAKRAKRVSQNAIEDLGKQINMNRYKQINMAKIEKQKSGNPVVFFSPYTPTGKQGILYGYKSV